MKKLNLILLCSLLAPLSLTAQANISNLATSINVPIPLPTSLKTSLSDPTISFIGYVFSVGFDEQRNNTHHGAVLSNDQIGPYEHHFSNYIPNNQFSNSSPNVFYIDIPVNEEYNGSVTYRKQSIDGSCTFTFHSDPSTDTINITVRSNGSNTHLTCGINQFDENRVALSIAENYQPGL